MKKLISDPVSIFFCSESVELCNEIIADHPFDPKFTSPDELRIAVCSSDLQESSKRCKAVIIN